MPLETILNRDENGQIISYIFHVWPQSKQSSEYKAIIDQARRERTAEMLINLSCHCWTIAKYQRFCHWRRKIKFTWIK